MAVKLPLIAIVGRPNVGKSTLFNRILGEKKALVEDLPGVTRDRNYALVKRFSVPFNLVDTGGFELDPKGELEQLTVAAARLAMEEADLIICLFDGSVGSQPGDGDIVELLRMEKRDCFYVVNKCDGQEQQVRKADFYALGIAPLYDLSALHGRGVSELVETMLGSLANYDSLLRSASDRQANELEALRNAQEQASLVSLEEVEFEDQVSPTDPVEAEDQEVEFSPVYLPDDIQSYEDYEREHRLAPSIKASAAQPVEGAELFEGKVEAPELIKVAIIGRPNVGKSTLLNTLAGVERAITSPLAGTTRDSVDFKLTRDGQDYLIVDTAGLRKKSKISQRVERYSTVRAIQALSDCDVAVMVLDATEGPTEQDGKILGAAHEQGKGIVIAVNKWDAIEKDHKSVKKFEEEVREAFKFVRYAPVVYISALSGKRCPRVIETAKSVAIERLKRVSTARLNQVLQRSHRHLSAPSYRGQPIRLYYAAQIGIAPPKFVLFFNFAKGLHFSYLRFLKNTIREEFGFLGSDIQIVIRKRQNRER